MAPALIVLLIALILGGAGFAWNVLWWIALVVFVFWLAGWVVGAGASTGGRRVWYR